MRAVTGYAGTGSHAPHLLHADDRPWPESNCYVDLWVEILHALQLDPMAAMAFTLRLDFEEDQYTFFKFPLGELADLYGIDVEELNLWRPLHVHAAGQIALGRFFIPEVDSFYLPDTAGVSYRIEHTKTSIAIDGIDVEARRLRYFHNRGYYELADDAFAGIFRLDDYAAVPGSLPPYAEIAKTDRVTRRSASDLARRAVALTRLHLARRPARNPIGKHRERLARDLEWLKGEPLATFHQYAFATVRQVGSCFAITANYLRWLEANGQSGLEAAATAFDVIASTAKTAQFKLARMANLRREVDVALLFDTMERAWDDGMACLVERYGD